MTATVLATGGAGYVGSHCCKAFVDAGYRVVVFDNLSRGWRDFVRWGQLIEGDVTDRAAVADAIGKVRPDVVAHFAALAYVGESVAEPDAYYRTNVLGALNVVDAMREAGVSKFLFSSSCATYGPPVRTPIDEDHPQAPISPYGRSKLMVEQILADYGGAFGLRHVALRYFNAGGADPGGEIGERHAPETHAIPLVINSAMGGAPFRIFGDDYPTPDGTAVRDYVHVTDLAAAHQAAVAHLLDGGASEAFNLGSGVGCSVREILRAVEAVAGRRAPSLVAPRRPGDPPMLVAAADKARAKLGWTPRFSDIDQIVASAWRWHAGAAAAAAPAS